MGGRRRSAKLVPIVVTLALIAGGGTGAGASSSKNSPIPAQARTELLAQAKRVALAEGERHPYDIEVVLTTRISAIRLNPGETVPPCEQSPVCAGSHWYVLAMRGHFSCNTCSHPLHSRLGPGTVIKLEIEARTPLPPHSGFAFNLPYPKLAAVGTPVRLDRPRPHTHR